MKKTITITYALLCTLCLSAQILVIPDVHGRAFWKEAVERHLSQPAGQSVRTVVFLGDYLIVLCNYSEDRRVSEQAVSEGLFMWKPNN